MIKKRAQVSSHINDIVPGLELLIQNKKISFNVEIIRPSGTISILCDPRRIGQVITNLVKNSVDFVPDKDGKITIRTRTTCTTQDNTGNPNCLIFTIEDNGSGIPAEKIDNLFKKFYQIDTSVKRKHGGTGLGLVICKVLLKDMEEKFG